MRILEQNKKWIALLTVFISINTYSVDIEKYYLNMPDRLNPTMTHKNKLELLEYHKAAQADTIQNNFGGNVYIEVFDTASSHIIVKNTKCSTFDMMAFKLESGKPIIGIINTVCAPVCQSNIAFYDTTWNNIPLQFKMPKATQWLMAEKDSSDFLDKTWLMRLLQNSYISLQFDASNLAIVAKNNSTDIMSDIDKRLMTKLLNNSPITYQLKGLMWVLKP